MSRKGLEVKRTWGGKEKLKSLIKAEKDARVKERLQAVLWRLKRKSYTEIADNLQKRNNTITDWVKRWNRDGYEGLIDKPRPGAPKILSNQEEQSILDYVKNSHSGTRNTCKSLAYLVEKEFGKELTQNTIRNLLVKNRLSWKKPDKVDYRQNDEERAKVMEDLKKIKRNSKGITVLVLG